LVDGFFRRFAAYGIYNSLRQQRQADGALRQQTQNVVVSAQELPAGTAINDDLIKKGMVKAVQRPKASVPAGSFSSPEQVVGKTNRAKIMANEPILESRLTGEGAGLTTKLEASKRAKALGI